MLKCINEIRIAKIDIVILVSIKYSTIKKIIVTKLEIL